MPDTQSILHMMASNQTAMETMLQPSRSLDAYVRGSPYPYGGPQAPMFGGAPPTGMMMDPQVPYQALAGVHPQMRLGAHTQSMYRTSPRGFADHLDPRTWVAPQTAVDMAVQAPGFLASGAQMTAYTSLLTHGVGGHMTQMASPLTAGLAGGLAGLRGGLTSAGVAGARNMNMMEAVRKSMSMGGAGMGRAAIMGGAAAGVSMAGIAAVKGAYSHFVADPIRQQQEVEDMLRTFGREQLPGRYGQGFSQGEANQMGSFLEKRVDQNVLGRTGMLQSFGEAQRFMATGVNMGMYRGTQNVDQFKKKFDETLQAARKVAEVLNTTVTEGLGFIKEAEQYGVYQPGQAGKFYSEMKQTAVGGQMTTKNTMALAAMGAGMGTSLGGPRAPMATAYARYGGSVNLAMRGGMLDTGRLRDAYGGVGVEEAGQQFLQRSAGAAHGLLRGRQGTAMLAALMDDSNTGVDETTLNRLARGELSAQDMLQMGRKKLQSGSDVAQFRLYRGEVESALSSKLSPHRLLYLTMEQRYGQTRAWEDPMKRRLLMHKATGLGARELEAVESMGQAGGMMDLERDIRQHLTQQEGRVRSESGPKGLTGAVKEALRREYLDWFGKQDREVRDWSRNLRGDLIQYFRKRAGFGEVQTTNITEDFAMGMAAMTTGRMDTARDLLGSSFDSMTSSGGMGQYLDDMRSGSGVGLAGAQVEDRVARAIGTTSFVNMGASHVLAGPVNQALLTAGRGAKAAGLTRTAGALRSAGVFAAQGNFLGRGIGAAGLKIGGASSALWKSSGLIGKAASLPLALGGGVVGGGLRAAGKAAGPAGLVLAAGYGAYKGVDASRDVAEGEGLAYGGFTGIRQGLGALGIGVFDTDTDADALRGVATQLETGKATALHGLISGVEGSRGPYSDVSSGASMKRAIARESINRAGAETGWFGYGGVSGVGKMARATGGMVAGVERSETAVAIAQDIVSGGGAMSPQMLQRVVQGKLKDRGVFASGTYLSEDYAALSELAGDQNELYSEMLRLTSSGDVKNLLADHADSPQVEESIRQQVAQRSADGGPVTVTSEITGETYKLTSEQAKAYALAGPESLRGARRDETVLGQAQALLKRAKFDLKDPHKDPEGFAKQYVSQALGKKVSHTQLGESLFGGLRVDTEEFSGFSKKFQAAAVLSAKRIASGKLSSKEESTLRYKFGRKMFQEIGKAAVDDGNRRALAMLQSLNVSSDLIEKLGGDYSAGNLEAVLGKSGWGKHLVKKVLDPAAAAYRSKADMDQLQAFARAAIAPDAGAAARAEEGLLERAKAYAIGGASLKAVEQLVDLDTMWTDLNAGSTESWAKTTKARDTLLDEIAAADDEGAGRLISGLQAIADEGPGAVKMRVGDLTTKASRYRKMRQRANKRGGVLSSKEFMESTFGHSRHMKELQRNKEAWGRAVAGMKAGYMTSELSQVLRTSMADQKLGAGDINTVMGQISSMMGDGFDAEELKDVVLKGKLPTGAVASGKGLAGNFTQQVSGMSQSLTELKAAVDGAAAHIKGKLPKPV